MTVLLVHGGAASGRMWDPVVQLLGPETACTAPDLPGHGTRAAEAFPGLAGCADELAGQLVGPIVVVGYSLGAQVAMELVARHPAHVRGAVLISGLTRPVPVYGRVPSQVMHVLGPRMRSRRTASKQATWLGIPPGPAFEQWVADAGAVRSSVMAAVLKANRAHRLPPGLTAAGVPLHVLAGANEHAVVRASVEEVGAAVPGTRAELVEGLDHDIPFRDPQRVVDAVRALL